MNIFRLFTKFLVLPLFLIVSFNILEYGFEWNRPGKYIYPVILTIFTMVIFLKKDTRKYILIFSVLVFSLMIFFYLLIDVNLANTIGSFGFALLLIVVASYIPQIIKKGFVEKF